MMVIVLGVVFVGLGEWSGATRTRFVVDVAILAFV